MAASAPVGARAGSVALAVCAVVTLLAAHAVVTRLRLDPDVASLLPERGEAADLRRYLGAFGGADLAVVLVEGEDTTEVSEVARALAAELGALPSVRLAADGVGATARAPSPLLAWRYADRAARDRLARALSPDGMRERLRGTRALLLAPGGGASEALARDPLRLWALLGDGDAPRGGPATDAEGRFASSDGRARLVLVRPAGQALRGADARAFVAETQAVLDRVARGHPGLFLGLAGGHALAAATEGMLVADMKRSGALALALAAAAFALAFRRVRALAAVLPPLALGTLWTAGLAAHLPGGLSAVAVGFMSVVLGVGFDTGVHVYAALLEARRDGLAPAEAAARARRRTARPVLAAATTAAAAFATLALSDLVALRQLGLLCAAGELLTALAILLLTPEIGRRLEPVAVAAAPAPRWSQWLARVGGPGRRGALATLLLALAPAVALGFGAAPMPADAVVALRPRALAPLEVQARIDRAFGGRPGQWVVMLADAHAERARERADVLAERLRELSQHVEAVDALGELAPAPATQRARLEARDALGLADRAPELARALTDEGFAAERFADALAELGAPPSDIVDHEALGRGDDAILVSRFVAADAGGALAVVYVLPREEPRPGDEVGAALARARNAEHRAAIEAAIHEVEPTARITGYGRLESALRAALVADLPRVGGAAALFVILALALALRRASEVMLAAVVVAATLGMVLVGIRVLGVPLHVYDALVLPVLLGITVDEAMFLLFRARRARRTRGGPGAVVATTLTHEARLVAATALTTAAGFAALLACDFDGLRHLGAVGVLGSVTGMIAALVVVPAGLRLVRA
jgi:predicted RND superfamily exporter protein